MNILRKKTLPRRAFIKGAGVSIALPMLDAMIPALNAKSLKNNPRLICIEEVHGLPGCNELGAKKFLFAPQSTGRNYELVNDNVLKSLEKWRENTIIISNTDVRMAEPIVSAEIGGDHFRSSAVFLTQTHPKQTQGSDIHCGTSLDQLHANKFGQETILPSLQICIEPTDKGGGCDYNYSCSYTDCISWKSPTEPLPMIRNPRTAFDLLFGAGGTNEERMIRRKTHSSILDWVINEIQEINKYLGPIDRRRIGNYLSSVREIERRIQKVEEENSAGKKRELPGAPPGVPDSFSKHMELMFDLQVLALQTDITRVISFKTGRDASNRIFLESGSNKAFHPSSHHGNKEKGVMEWNKISKYRVGQMAYFLKKLQETNDGESSLLDQSMIIWGSPMGDGNLHNHRRCPLVVFGGANGQLKGGIHIKADDGTPMANVMLNLLHKMGHDIDSFGDSTTTLSI
mgnify:FL=1|tara:strand:+ start:798 stop:2168 length:1371 start_codon:yes stop_codon:yes gene_type:complete